jgi:hypothetical protein
VLNHDQLVFLSLSFSLPVSLPCFLLSFHPFLLFTSIH